MTSKELAEARSMVTDLRAMALAAEAKSPGIQALVRAVDLARSEGLSVLMWAAMAVKFFAALDLVDEAEKAMNEQQTKQN